MFQVLTLSKWQKNNLKIMSDNYIYVNRPTERIYVDREITVNEHKAPTDDSIRLYGEMLDKARSELVDAFKVDNNIVKGRIGLYRNCSRLGYIVVVKTNINGNPIETSIDVDDYHGDRQVLVDMLAKEISKAITKELLVRCEDFHLLGR